VYFYDASDDSLIGTDLGVSSGATASTEWTGLAWGTSYSWYVIVDDGMTSVNSPDWNFTTNYVPSIPINPNPLDASTRIFNNPMLSVEVSDADGDPVDVYFYDASDDSLIGTDLGVSSGATASIEWTGLAWGTSYSWYVIVDDGMTLINSPIFYFVTNFVPLISNPLPPDGSSMMSFNPTLSVDISDADGDIMDVYFYDASDDSLIGTDLGVSSGGTASVSWLGLSGNTNYQWYTIATDGLASTQSATWSFSTANNAPNAPTNPVPADGATGVSGNPVLSVDVSDLDGDSMDVSFYDASDDSLIGTDTGVLSGGTASVSWLGLSGNTNYQWYAIATDGLASIQSATWSFSTANNAPNAPTNPVPADGATGVSGNPVLSVDVSDLDGDSMDVSFYDASDDSLIGTDTGVLSGGTASVSWLGLSEGMTYQWYAIATDGFTSTQSATWSLTVLEDTPTWDVMPTNQTIQYGNDFSYDLNASDSSGIDNWWINDTLNFAIGNDGMITNIVILSVGVYWLEVRAYDAYGRCCSAIFKVTVEEKPDGGGGGGDGGGGGGGDGGGEEAIPGYDLLFTLALIAIMSLILIRKKNKVFSY
ncbi:MAG: hypothetical protein ACFFHV_05080, partial [Promethearchaeota archaeon]